MHNLAQLIESANIDDLLCISAKEAVKIDTARAIYDLRYINGYEHRIDFWYSLCDMYTGQCKLLQKHNSQYVYETASARMEWFRMGKIYRVTEEFEMFETWFKVNVPTKEQTKVGDLFELYAEPSAKKKLYRLIKINTKFPYTLQVRPNDFKRHFELVESEESS